jgi:pimeloyl-ACP methyl ester carboxylesterase
LPFAARLAYEEHGGGSENPPLVFVHGAGGSRLHWPPSLRRISGLRCLALDLAGHGQSPDEGEASIDDHVRRLDEWRRELGLERAFLAGHSMGSAVVLTAALNTPEWVAGTALLGAGARLPVNPQLLEGIAHPATFIETVERIVGWSFGRQAPPRRVELARQRMIETGPAVLLRDFLACSVFDVRDRVGGLQVPTVVVCGAEDRMTPPALGEELARSIPNARRIVVEGAGHMVMLEKPDEVETALRGMILRGEATPDLRGAQGPGKPDQG